MSVLQKSETFDPYTQDIFYTDNGIIDGDKILLLREAYKFCRCYHTYVLKNRNRDLIRWDLEDFITHLNNRIPKLKIVHRKGFESSKNKDVSVHDWCGQIWAFIDDYIFTIYLDEEIFQVLINTFNIKEL